MPLATFTLEDADPGTLRFQIAQLPRQKVDVLRTLLRLDGLDEGIPLLIEERYLQERDGLNLLLRLRLEPELAASRSPVFMRLRAPVENHVRHDPKYAVLCTRGVTLLREGEEPSEEAIVEARPISPAEHLDILESLVVRPPGARSRHDLANEWGPHRLWRGYARLAGSVEEPAWSGEAFYRLRQQEYYAYLLGLAALRSRGSAEPTETEALAKYEAFFDGYRGSALRVLLLDDEIGAGWGEAVRAVLERDGVIEVDTSLADVDFDTDRACIKAKVDEGWDLVLADLRISTADRERAPSRGAVQYGGAEWIRQIKQAHPETAVVAFTASNKAWSVQELRELGVDGYWVKESHELGVDDGYSETNAARLLTVVRKALEPRIEARPVWALRADIARIREDRSGKYDRGWAEGMGRHALDVLPRLQAIDERIRRAYGFLVMSRSQHEEDEFAMRQHDLAVLTLWSVINETVYLHFDDPRRDPSFTFKGQLEKAWDAKFAVRNPRAQAREVYWHLKKGQEVVAPQAVPADLVDDLCPGSSQSKKKGDVPMWPWGRAETAGVAWLLQLAGEAELARRFDEREYNGRPGLRELRNKLEYEHGRLGDLEESTLDDVHALCEVWRALLVTPYDMP